MLGELFGVEWKCWSSAAGVAKGSSVCLIATLSDAAACACWACKHVMLLLCSALLRCRCIVSGRELVIILGKRSVLVPQQDSLALLSNQTVLYDMLDAAALFKGSKQVAMCSNCGAPEAAITGPTVRTSC